MTAEKPLITSLRQALSHGSITSSHCCFTLSCFLISENYCYFPALQGDRHMLPKMLLHCNQTIQSSIKVSIVLFVTAYFFTSCAISG